MIDRYELIISVLVFIGIPMLAGFISKNVLIRSKGSEWFENKYKPFMGKIAIVSLLITLIVFVCF